MTLQRILVINVLAEYKLQESKYYFSRYTVYFTSVYIESVTIRSSSNGGNFFAAAKIFDANIDWQLCVNCEQLDFSR